jgi:hypothetical protein
MLQVVKMYMARKKQKDMKSINKFRIGFALYRTYSTILTGNKTQLYFGQPRFRRNEPSQDQLHNVGIEKNFYKSYAQST